MPVWVHENDVPLTPHPTQYARERSPLVYAATKPRALPVIWGFLRTRAFVPKPIGAVERYEDGELDVPGGRGSSSRRATRSGTARCTSPSGTS